MIQTNTTVDADHSSSGVLLISAGGKGCEAADKARRLLGEVECTTPYYHISIDTDSAQTSLADVHINISINATQAATIKANAIQFGPVVVKILEHLDHMFDPVELEHGARTTPAMTQVMFEYHKHKLISHMRKAIDHLKRSCRKIRIFIVHSTGGGSGRAISILLPLCLAESSFRTSLTYGYDPNILEVPATISGYAINHARHDATEQQAVKICANHVAWSRESDFLLRNQKLMYAAHVGYSNHSAVNSTAEELTDVMAEAIFDLLTNFPYFKSRWVDSVSSPKDSLRATDLPEERFPSVKEERRRQLENKDNN
ncbi:MAG: hypothetical protein AAF497_02305 [Planctomycetota bacterium]